MPYETLITPKALSIHLTDPGWVVIDCRHDTSDPNWGPGEYAKNHIPMAIYANVNDDLAGKVTDKTGRHPLPDQNTIISKFGAWGISTNSQVVVYDQADGSMASRLWWLLRYFGHTSVAVLDGGFQKWVREDLPVSSAVEHNKPVTFRGIPHLEMLVDIDLVKRVRLNPEWLVIDARAPERHLGIAETIDPVAGHIPGSVNYYFGDNLNPGSTYRDTDELTKRIRCITSRSSARSCNRILWFRSDSLQYSVGISTCWNPRCTIVSGIMERVDSRSGKPYCHRMIKPL